VKRVHNPDCVQPLNIKKTPTRILILRELFHIPIPKPQPINFQRDETATQKMDLGIANVKEMFIREVNCAKAH
jgi:hypothetical protein